MWQLGRDHFHRRRSLQDAFRCVRESLAYDVSFPRLVHPVVHHLGISDDNSREVTAYGTNTSFGFKNISFSEKSSTASDRSLIGTEQPSDNFEIKSS